MRIFSTLRSAALVLALVTLPAPARAQDTVADVISFLMTNQAVRTGDVERDRAAAEAARNAVANALLVNLTSTPLASSSSGFLYRLNPALGTVERATESFGSFFVERALTAGAGRASFGVSASTATFARLDGHDLRDGSFLTIANRFRDEAAPFDVETLTLDITTSEMTLLGSVGITDRLEIGGAVPFLRLTLDGERVNVYRGDTFVQAGGSAAASGIGDVALRAKYTIARLTAGGVAAAAELRLPTGDEANLLGAGARSLRVLGIASFESGRFAFHGNGGFLRGGISDEIGVAGSASYAASPRVTIAGELLVRRIDALREVIVVTSENPSISGADTVRLVAGDQARTIVNAVTGVKWNVNGTMVIAAHLMWPLAHVGLTPRVTPTVAFEYAF
jgi:hypothetical protein